MLLHSALRCFRHVLVALAVLCGCNRTAGGAPPQPVVAPAQTPAPPPPSQAAGQPMRWSGRLAAGATLELHEIDGTVRVTAAAGDQADLVATATGAGSDRIPLRIDQDEEGVRVRVDERDGRCDRDRQVPPIDMIVRVPAGVRLLVRTVGASIDVDGVKGPIDVTAVNGRIDLRAVPAGKARTTNGSIRAAFNVPELRDDSELSTVNGTVDVVLPVGASAEVAARSVSGTVSVDFPLSGSFEPHGAHGNIGHGGHALRLRTVNGSIHVARGA